MVGRFTRAPHRHVGISLGRIGSLMDGLGEFSSQLCQQLAAAAPEWQDRWGVRFHIHLPRRWTGVFGEALSYLPVHKYQATLHLQPRRFELWHAHNQMSRLLPPWGSRHRLLTVHDLNPVYHDAPEQAAQALGKLRRHAAHFDALTTLTRYVEGDLRQHLGWAGPIHVIPNGVRDLSEAPREAVPALAGRRFFFHLSRMARSKNPDLLLELAPRWPQHQFVLAGPASGDSARLRETAHARGLNNVLVLENISDAQKAWLYAECEAFLFPSITEGFGLPPLEAMCLGKPVFLSTCTCLPEVGGDAAAYWPELNAAAMSAVMSEQLPRLQQRAAAIKAHAAQYRWDTAARAYLALYRTLMGLE